MTSLATHTLYFVEMDWIATHISSWLCTAEISFGISRTPSSSLRNDFHSALDCPFQVSTSALSSRRSSHFSSSSSRLLDCVAFTSDGLRSDWATNWNRNGNKCIKWMEDTEKSSGKTFRMANFFSLRFFFAFSTCAGCSQRCAQVSRHFGHRRTHLNCGCCSAVFAL